MSRCGRTAQLEAVALGEVSSSVAHELRAHAKHCALCRHELNWLESESAIFRQRAGRDEVAQLWKGVASRSGLDTKRPWPRVLVAMAAAAVLVMVAGGTPRQVSLATAGSGGEETLESSMLMSPAFLFFETEEPCSRLPTGVGFQCSPVVPASFLASR